MNDNTQKGIGDLIQEIEDDINGTTLSKADKAEEIIATASAYMNAMTEINNNYNEALGGLIEELKVLKEKSDEIEEAQRLTKVKISLYE